MNPSLNLNLLFSQWVRYTSVYACTHRYTHKENFPILLTHLNFRDRRDKNYKFPVSCIISTRFLKCCIYHKTSFAVWLNYLLTILFLLANKLLTVVISTTCHHLTKNKALKENLPGNKTKVINLKTLLSGCFTFPESEFPQRN